MKKRSNEIVDSITQNRLESRLNGTREDLDYDRKILGDTWSLLKKSYLHQNNPNNNDVLGPGNVFNYEED